MKQLIILMFKPMIEANYSVTLLMENLDFSMNF